MNIRRFALLALATSLATTAVAQRGRGAGGSIAGPMSLEASADRIFAQFNSTHTPGCAVGVRQNGRDLLLRGYGMADLESSRPILATTILESGSVAKQFTATAVFLLIKDGKVSLDDPVRKHIPELPEYPRPLLVRHLLSHTSGLREWSNLVAFTGWPRGTRLHTQQDLVDAAVAQKSLNYPVGDYYSYTNTGFALLTTIVERVSGKPFAQFSDERIFRPLGLTSTRWRDDFTTVVPGRAQAYARRGDGWELSMPLDNIHGPGGLLTTVGDWLRWNDHLTAKTLGADVVALLTEQAKLTSGRTISYARGVTVGQYRGTTEIAHSGSTAGYSTYLARYPQKELSIAVMCNAAGANATSFTRQLVDAIVPDLMVNMMADTVAADPAALAKLAGIYRSSRTHEPMSIGGIGGGRGGNVSAVGGGGWRLGNSQMLVDNGADGRARSLRVLGADADTVQWIRVASDRWAPSQDQLTAFAGRYQSPEIPNTTWTLSIEGGRLVASVRPAIRVPLTPVYPDAFTAGEFLGTVWFVRDARGAVTEMHSGSARVWDFTFTKAK
jgi:CubicO group peptidase (beta-lactamase class C family)